MSSTPVVPLEIVDPEPQPQPKHARYGPSSLKNREVCPGWENDPHSDKTAADEGTDCHYGFETGRRGKLNDEQWEQVTKCLRFIAPFEAKASKILKELRLRILGGLTFGTADRVILVGKKAYLVDAKFGRGEIDDAEENRQGFAYTLGVFETFPEIEEVEVIFLIPRRDEVTRHTFRRSDIPRLELTVRTIIARAQKFAESHDESLLNVTETNCTYCRKFHTVDGKSVLCPKLGGYALTIAKKYAPLEIVDEVHSSQITDPQKMANLYIAVRVLEKLVDSAKKHVIDFARENQLPGFELRERAGQTKITDPVLAYPVLRKFFDETEIASCSTYSYSDLQKLLSDKTEKGKKSEKVRELYLALTDADAVRIFDGSQYLQRVKSEKVVTE